MSWREASIFVNVLLAHYNLTQKLKVSDPTLNSSTWTAVTECSHKSAFDLTRTPPPVLLVLSMTIVMCGLPPLDTSVSS